MAAGLRIAAVAPLLLLLLGAGCAGMGVEGPAVQVPAPPPPADGHVAVGKGYIDFVGRDLGGKEVRLSDLVGRKVVILQFWGIRCSPCLEEMPFLAGLQERYGPEGLQVLGVNTDRTAAEALSRAMAERNLAPPYPILVDPDLAISQHYTKWLIPVTVVIDRRGVVRAVHTGFKRAMAPRFEEEVRAILRESG
ncbi:TlpA disulfide reductase family protein [Deferrisoma camini]|uniref:TlpA disulfide reductase family protein n=1 Tax=Deferrisoma camini TaxID=1035120 RepID=UPI00046C9643|nr:TlpA disulfide reductase family protein [Deferrisoma camini]